MVGDRSMVEEADGKRRGSGRRASVIVRDESHLVALNDPQGFRSPLVPRWA